MEVIDIKNYYDQLRELEIAKVRLKTLLDTKDIYFTLTQPGGVSYDGERVTGGVINNSFDIYVGKVEDINKKIDEVKVEIKILEHNLKVMEISLRKMKGSHEKIFVAKYIDGLTINQMCRRFNYSRPQIYRKLDYIKKILNITKDETK